MKKKPVLFAVAVLALSLSLFIPSVQAFAVSALSVFRVGNVRTIMITLSDMEEFMEYARMHEDLFDRTRPETDIEAKDRDSHPQPNLNSVSEFEWFSVNLPREMRHENPAIYGTEPRAVQGVIDVRDVNLRLSRFYDAPMLDAALDGAEFTLRTPPALSIVYENLAIFATQLPYIEAERWVKESLESAMLAMPFLSNNLRRQLADIGIDNRHVYLPVIMGLGREVSFGGTVGYIYSMSDFNAITGREPGELNVSVLVWTQDGVLFTMAGDRTDNELVALARSMR